MSLYNVINGFNTATFWFLPMLDRRPEEYPRFRDCFVGDKNKPEYDDHIHIYTRTGGGNRLHYEEQNQAMRDMEGFVTDYDDSFDSTYASWVFEIPEKWREAYKAIVHSNYNAVSDEYWSQINKIYPERVDLVSRMKERLLQESSSD